MAKSREQVANGFVEFALSQNALKFGEFTLKSGRQSPYFFNCGHFCSGEALANLGEYYANAIVASGVEFDGIFGPAYKGIPLGAAVSIALYNKHGRSVPYAYNRKEAKDHGEGGIIVGELAKRVLIVDDVISAGTAIRESMDMIKLAGSEAAGVAVALDRQEIFKEGFTTSAIEQVEIDFNMSVVSIAKMTDLIAYLETCYEKDDKSTLLTQINDYRSKYGSSSINK